MEEKFLSPQDVADLLQIKKNTVYEMIKRGELRATKLGKQFRISKSEVYDFMGTPISDDDTDKIIICGQDQILDALCALFNDEEGFRMKAFRSPMGSYRGLYEMYQNDNCVATAHLWDSESDTYNLPYVTRMLPGRKAGSVSFAETVAGVLCREGESQEYQNL